MSRAIVLVDGGYFDYINNYCRETYGSGVDIQKFGEKIAGHWDTDLLRLKYYHSLPYVDDDNPTRQQEAGRRQTQSFFDTIDNLPRCQHVDAGRVQKVRRNCQECGCSYLDPSQKGTDVQIAVDLVKMAFDAHSPESFVVVSGDEDLKHGMRVAKDTHSNVYLGYAYDPSYDLYSSKILRQESDDMCNVVDGFLSDITL
jgi:uncharacterized LabA/DUF88 family protein